MSGHGGFPISRRVAERVAKEAAQPNALGLGLNLAGVNSWLHTLSTVWTGERSTSASSMKGFKYLLPRVPNSKKNLTPEQEHAVEERLRKTTSRLARRVELGFDWGDHPDELKLLHRNLEKWENPYIPSGYTYLLQLVAHDLVATSFPISVLEQTTTGARNTRSAALRLDTIYGGGPQMCPLAYVPHGADVIRTALRLGWTRASTTNAARMRDIPRMPAPGAEGISQHLLTEVAIPDPRNDDNPIVAQMVVLFHLLHDAILDILKDKIGPAIGDETAMRRFLCARGAVNLVYRNVIRRDLLKKILHPSVYQYYKVDSMHSASSPDFQFLDTSATSPEGDARIPLEFSHAAFRFGHAMVRPSYRFNELHADEFQLPRVLRRSSSKKPEDLPLDRDWIISWSYFFKFFKDEDPIEKRRPRLNLTRRIGPDFSGGLVDAELFPPIDEITENKTGLAYRDFLVGGFLDLPSVDELVDAIRAKNKVLAKAVKLHKVADYREKLTSFLGSRTSGSGLEPTEIEALVRDPPLAFFILFEAAVDEETPGLRLGPLGSIVVADVILAAMARDPVTGEDSARTLAEALEGLSNEIYKTNYLADLDEINSMVDLINFVADRKKLGSEVPNFI